MVSSKKLCYTEWVFIGTPKKKERLVHEIVKEINTSKSKKL